MKVNDTPSNRDLGRRSRSDPRAVVPEELVTACAAGDCVLFAGTGVSIWLGYPSWRKTLEEVIAHAARRNRRLRLNDLQRALAAGKTSLVVELLVNRLSKQVLLDGISASFSGHADFTKIPQQALHSIPFTSVLTTSWDPVWERVFRRKTPVVVRPGARETAPQFLRSDSFEIVKLFGDIQVPDSLILTREAFRSNLLENPRLAKSLNSLLFSKSFFFIGTSLESIHDFLASVQYQLRGHVYRRHFAVVADEPDLSLHAEYFERNYNLQLIPVDAAAEWDLVYQLLVDLGTQVAGARGGRHVTPLYQRMTIETLRLENIGPYHALSLDFNEGWNVILGNNGSGKSTILKAIALALCGDDVEVTPTARKLLRAGADTGYIELRVGGNLHRTDVTREGEFVRVRSNQLSPLNAGTWVALGFPPMRGVSDRDPRGPAPDGIALPVVEDVLPLLSGSVDQRLSSLKQWVVNVDARSNVGDGNDEVTAGQSRKLRDSFFSLLARFVPGVNIEFSHVDRSTWQVYLRTDDGLITLDQISQGMSSLFGWVGTLLQRLHEIFSSSGTPEAENALVLVDEIDAHLHPEWQQVMVSLVKEIFPNLQVIATTHSPLLISGLTRAEVLVAKRDSEGMISVTRSPDEFEGMRADQLLTSSLFGLMQTRSRKPVDRYSELLLLESRTAKEDEELEALRRRLSDLLVPGETALQKDLEVALASATAFVKAPTAAETAMFLDAIPASIRDQLSESLGQLYR